LIAVRAIGVDLGDYAGFIPGVAISIIVALILSGSVARRLGTRRAVAWLLLASLGAVLSATVTPSREALLLHPATGMVGCDLSRVGPARWAEYLTLGTTSLNVVLFVPLGVAIGLLPHSQLKAALVLGAVILPIAIETVQLVVGPLGRACQSADVFDNLLGLVLGLLAGLTAAWIGRRA
jgi:hypothetical protein